MEVDNTFGSEPADAYDGLAPSYADDTEVRDAVPITADLANELATALVLVSGEPLASRVTWPTEVVAAAGCASDPPNEKNVGRARSFVTPEVDILGARSTLRAVGLENACDDENENIEGPANDGVVGRPEVDALGRNTPDWGTNDGVVGSLDVDALGQNPLACTLGNARTLAVAVLFGPDSDPCFV
jgi:hypothetical protein